MALKVPYIDLVGQHKTLRKEIEKAIGKVLDRADFILGKEVGELEDAFAKYCGTKYAVALNSGTDALFLALKGLGVGPGDEVITSPNSFLASATSIVALGATPVFVDVRGDQNMDPAKLEAVITPRTKAIMPVHLTGKIADMREIMKIAKKHKLFVIEDAAQAIGATYRGKNAGSFGDAGCFSVHPLKTLNACGDAGMMTTNNKKLAESVKQFRNIGLKNRTESDMWGYNSRLDTIQAAIILVKMKYVNKWVDARRSNADYYRKHLSDIVACPTEEKHEKHAYHVFAIQADRRDELQKYLLEKGVDTKIHYPTPIHLQVAAKGLGYKKGDFPEVEKQSNRILSLPIYQTLTRSQLEYVVKSIRSFYGK